VTHGSAPYADALWDETPDIDMDHKPSGSVFGSIATDASPVWDATVVSAVWNVGTRLFRALFSPTLPDNWPDMRWYKSSDDFRGGPSQVCFAPRPLHSFCVGPTFSHLWASIERRITSIGLFRLVTEREY
jgi:hypothetical protein